MRLQQITATPHPAGNQISLHWQNPSPNQYPGVRVVRREDTHPTTPNDGTLVKEGEGLEAVEDKGLKGETVYYYTLFPYSGSQQYHFDPHNRISAMATAPYNTAEQMYDLIPAIYHRYDAESGQLRDFLKLPGEQFDQLYSFATALLNAYNLDRVDERLLPLLAEWVGWQTDYRIEIAKQRNEIRYAPYLYQTIGLIPTLEATVKRFIGWESRTKEFVHNVFRSNCPERLNLWLRQRNSSDEWSQPTKPLSLNFAYEGRPSAIRDQSGKLWLFYHTFKQNRWEVWYKTYAPDENLNTPDEQWTPSQPLNNSRSIEKYPTTVLQGERLWVFWSTYVEAENHWQIQYRTHTDAGWSLVQSLIDDGQDRRQPWAVTDTSNGLWLFWIESFNGQQQLKYNRHDGSNWQLTDAATFPLANGEDPRAVNDVFVVIHPTGATQSLWMFWAIQEPVGAVATIDNVNHKLVFATSLALGLNNGDPVTVRAVAGSTVPTELLSTGTPPLLYVVNLVDTDSEHSIQLASNVGGSPISFSAGVNNIWVGSLTGTSYGTLQTRWQIAYRVKQGLDPMVTSDWSEVRTLPWAALGNDDREPSALVREDGTIELFWSSTRSGSWSIWHTLLDITTHIWGVAEPITTGAYSQHAPLGVADPDGTLLLYRSNQSLSYTSQVYSATETTDFRYAGCTTVDTRNLTKLNLRKQFDDFLTYTAVVNPQDRPTSSDDWYAWYARRDTVGLYLTPTTEDPGLQKRDQELLQNILPQFQPIQTRVEFFPQLVEVEERYDTIQKVKETLAEDIGFLNEAEIYSDGVEVAIDHIPEWQLFMTNTLNHLTVNSAISPINVRSRTWHSAITYVLDPDGGTP